MLKTIKVIKAIILYKCVNYGSGTATTKIYGFPSALIVNECGYVSPPASRWLFRYKRHLSSNRFTIVLAALLYLQLTCARHFSIFTFITVLQKHITKKESKTNAFEIPRRDRRVRPTSRHNAVARERVCSKERVWCRVTISRPSWFGRVRSILMMIDGDKTRVARCNL